MLQKHLVQEFKGSHHLDEMSRYHLGSGGKCLRGRLAMSEAKARNLEHEPALHWAMACELLHNATLIHDDIQDHDPIRRGQASLWKKYGVSQAINAGDLLIFKSFSIASQLNNADLVQLLAETSELLVRGQCDELKSLEFQPHGTWNSYQEMAKLKTGTLFKLPIHGIHLLCGLENNQNELDAWLELGVCYQIFDDIRDFLGLKQKGQKQKDFVEGRLNALVSQIAEMVPHKDLVKEYQEVEAHSYEQQEIIGEINQIIIENHLVEKLKRMAEEKLVFFKNNTQKGSQDIVLEFIHGATQKG
ncbi:MAG: polyprenyl synthetase family protein [Pseudomonadota bacterium]